MILVKNLCRVQTVLGVYWWPLSPGLNNLRAGSVAPIRRSPARLETLHGQQRVPRGCKEKSSNNDADS